MKKEKFERASYLFRQVANLERAINDARAGDASFTIAANMVTAEQYKLMRTTFIALLSTQQTELKEEIEKL